MSQVFDLPLAANHSIFFALHNHFLTVNIEHCSGIRPKRHDFVHSKKRNANMTLARIVASVIFFICSVAFFLSLLPWRSVGRSNFDWGLQKHNNVDSNNDIQI